MNMQRPNRIASILVSLLVTLTFCCLSSPVRAADFTHTTATLSEGRWGLAATTVGDKAIFAGGLWDYDISGNPISSDVVDIYDAQTGTWSTASLSQARFLLAGTSVGDKAFFAGGWEAPYGWTSDVVDIYDAGTDTWITSRLPQSEYGLVATSVGSKALFAGGNILGDIVDIYAVDTEQWDTATLSVPRSGLAATTVGNKAIFAGGSVAGGLSAVVDIYDAGTDSWDTASLSQARAGPAAVTVGNKAIFAGGMIPPGEMDPPIPYDIGFSDVVDIYDADTGQWSTATLSAPRFSLAAAAVGNLAFFAGGATPGPGGGVSDVVDIYNADTDTWTTTTLSMAGERLAATAVGNMVMFAGGWGPSDVVDIFIVPELLSGDANRDGVVSADDYGSVQSNFANTGHAGIPGDANGDGMVSADDYGSVQLNFGATAGMGSETTIPEPATLSLLVISGAGLLLNRRRRG